MNNFFFLIFTFLVSVICCSQNLVTNGSFEQHSSCPNGLSQIDSALSWGQPSTGIMGISGTSDYYHQCGISDARVPNGFLGFQQAHTGVAYAGIINYYQDCEYREYIKTELDSQLVTNECYHFEMWINLGNKCTYNSPNIGVYFSTTDISGITDYLTLPYSPQIINVSSNLPDTMNWTLVSGDYTAIGGEKFLIIGNFMNDANTTRFVCNPDFYYTNAYLHIDDVSLVPYQSTISISENNKEGINIYPNPASDLLNIHLDDPSLSEIILHDFTSTIVAHENFTGNHSFRIDYLPAGIYYYEIKNKNILVRKGKLIKK